VAKRKAKNEIADFLRRSMVPHTYTCRERKRERRLMVLWQDQKALAAIKAKGISKWTTEDVVRWLELTVNAFSLSLATRTCTSQSSLPS
jgi:prophage tail gpP-like protein